MRLGLIARADKRGISHQTLELHRHLNPVRTLVIDDPGSAALGFRCDPTWYPGARVAPPGFDRGDADWLLHGVDVVLAVETVYNWSFCDHARTRGVRTVVQLNPELWSHHTGVAPAPDQWWNPTSWRMNHLPPTTRLVPVPTPRAPFHTQRHDGPLRVLHVIGHQAAGDRNGTRVFAKALARTRADLHVTVVTQDRSLRFQWPRRRGLTHETVTGGVADRWDLYRNQDLLVLPRRYGGLCLPALEAQACGMAVIMTDTSPQDSDWPAVERCRTMTRGRLHTQGGVLQLADADPRDLAERIDRHAKDHQHHAAARDAASVWAHSSGWDVWTPEYVRELADVLEVAA